MTRLSSKHCCLAIISILTLARDVRAEAVEWKAPASTRTVPNPLADDAEAAARGGAVFATNCVACHGAVGKGDGTAAGALTPKPPDLTEEHVTSHTDGELFWKIRTGRAPMPSFQDALPEKQVWEVVRYLRSLAPATTPPESANTSDGGTSDGAGTAELRRAVDELSHQLDQVRQFASDERSGFSNYLLTGYGYAGFVQNFNANESSFGAGLTPIFLWHPMEKLFFEAELEVALGAGEPFVALEYAQLAYFVADYLTVGAGFFLNPINAFGERRHPSWINRLPDAPLPFGHGGLVSTTEVGAQVRGAIPLGPGSVTYAVFISNGPRLNTGVDEPDEAGLLHFDNFTDVNPLKSFGGRLAYRPLRGLEVGAGAQYGRVGPANTDFAKVNALTFCADLSLGRSFVALRGALDFQAQFVWSRVDEAEYQGRKWNNWRSGVYAQVSYRPLLAGSDVLKAVEPVFRVDGVFAAPDSPSAMTMVRYTGGLDYWVGQSAVVKLAVEHTPAPGQPQTRLLAQFAMGF